MRTFQNINVDFGVTAIPSFFSKNVKIEHKISATRRAVDEHQLSNERRHAYYCDASVVNMTKRTAVAVAWKQTVVAGEPQRWVAKGFRVTQFILSEEAEAFAIVQALKIAIERTKDNGGFRTATIIYSDCTSVLGHLQGFPSVRQRFASNIYKIVELANSLRNNAVDLSFCWVPGHIAIPGNTLADTVAKAALQPANLVGIPSAGEVTTDQGRAPIHQERASEKKKRKKLAKKNVRARNLASKRGGGN